MPTSSPAKILRIHFSEDDRYQGAPLYEAIVQKCRDMKIAGATVLRGVEGYGETGGIHRHRVGGGDRPVIVVVVDAEEKIAQLAPVLESMMNTGMIAVSDADVMRVQRGAAKTDVSPHSDRQ
jgi:uncharacterized protein